MCVCVCVCTPLPPWGWVLWRRSNRVVISVYCKPLRSWIEVSATVERMYVNNSNRDSHSFKIYFEANISSLAELLEACVDVWVNRVSIPATGRYYLATLMSSDRTKQICLWMTMNIYIYCDIFINKKAKSGSSWVQYLVLSKLACFLNFLNQVNLNF